MTARRGENLLAIAVIPIAALVFFSTVSFLDVPSDPAVDWILPGTLALAVIASGLVNLGIATAYERSYGVLKRLGGSPLGRSGLIAGKLVSVAVVVAIQTVGLVAAATLIGWRPGPGVGPLLFLAALAGGTVTFTGLGLLLAGTLRAEATLALANGLFLVALLLGGILVPTSSLPPAVAAIADLLPAAALAELLRVALGAGGSVMPAALVLVAWGVGAIVLAARTFRWE
ncbi:MAG TPA: ABC transporter permease [Candidatus Limnocylindrales bacterium]|nr:ABC transporter permease [Candidatus Limnocylindrales bacterium]